MQMMSSSAVQTSQQMLPIVCLACRNDITTAKGNRLLKTDASIPLISKLLEEEYLQKEPGDVNTSSVEDIDVNVHALIYNNAKMCRHCFTQCNRVTDLLDSISKRQYEQCS